MSGITRRRALTVLAAGVAAPAVGGPAPARWHGRAFGAEAQITLHGMGQAALARVPELLDQIEAAFSLYRESELVRLNREGRLAASPRFAALLGPSEQVWQATGGRFDPTVQPVWRALALGERVDRQGIGWEKLRIDRQLVRLAPGQALTFNGIAQGWAADVVTAHLRANGARRVLVDMGEPLATGGPFRIGLLDPELGLHGWRSLSDGALATSSPAAMSLGTEAHILDPRAERRPLWSSVTVEAETGWQADGFSTGFIHMTEAEIAAVLHGVGGLRRVVLVTLAGEVKTLAS
ncbi:FAD:protein FMN transferase [Vannielia sp.]|uniref:FAD:protein FMN transferase n=1 Tax=Vannielia sp. TaxID=2813045 RepID=UPI00262F4AE5|nr:FAD:protein FMN transferase [Vannielia sp.]MDF1872894.1 FAD:protein FMN transferase [Vannielia sp.]